MNVVLITKQVAELGALQYQRPVGGRTLQLDYFGGRAAAQTKTRHADRRSGAPAAFDGMRDEAQENAVYMLESMACGSPRRVTAGVSLALPRYAEAPWAGT